MSRVLPVIVSGEQSAYALARLMHEATGERVLCVSPAPIEAISRSAFIDLLHVPMFQDDDAIVDTLRKIADDNPDAVIVALANHDRFARFAADNRERLGERVIMPYPDRQAFDAVSDKTRFSALCREHGVPVPPETVVDLADLPDGQSWQAPEIELRFPVVAKALDSDQYARLAFSGKAKVYIVEDQTHLDQVWARLRRAGYRGRFLVQERIPGDDTCGVSLTVYIDSRGVTTLRSSAQVLVEDHDPEAIGNPVAMLLKDYPSFHEEVGRILTAVGYRGFANVDVKIDPRDGRHYFFEINPRMGRNCWYVRTGGVNLMEPMLADLVEGQALEPVTAVKETVYSLIPDRLIMRYLREPGLRRRVRAILRAHGSSDPMINPSEPDLRRRLIVRLQRLNYYRKMARFYPAPVEAYLPASMG